MADRKKRYDPRNRWSAKYRKDVKLWIPSRKTVYLYWFRFLQIAEQDPNRTVDWSKYQGWGGANAILGMKFDEWWEGHWVDLFGIENEGDEPKYPLTTKRPKTDGIRYALRIYENRHKGSTWDIAIWFKRNEKRMYFLEFFGKIQEDMDTKTRLRQDGQGNAMDDNSEAYLNALGKRDVQRKVSRYLKSAEQYLDNVCEGKFP
jgi:hypothetical protein